MTLRYLALGVALLAMPVNAAEPPLQLAPSSPWIADFAEDNCALRRAFSAGTDTVVFEMRQFVPNSGIQVVVTSNTLDDRKADPRTQFMPNDGEPRRQRLFRPVSNAEGWKGVAVLDALTTASEPQLSSERDTGQVWPVADRVRRENGISGYFIGAAFERDLLLQTGSLREPMRIMQVCLDDLLTSWGLDPAVQAALTRQATADFEKHWVVPIVRAQADLARSADVSAVSARLLVDETGKATDCQLLEGVAAQDRTGKFCEAVIKWAEFAPALDANGQPVKSYFLWLISFAPRAPFDR